MIYIVGSKGIIFNSLKILFDDKLKVITRQNKKDHIKTNIFNNKFDAKNEKSLKLINKKDIVIILSNPGNIYFCEKNPEKLNKFLNNLTSNFLSNLNKKTRIIFFSSDYVFSGKKNIYFDNSKTSPINKYGAHKVYIENYIKKRFNNYLILRLPKIFSNDLKINSIISESYLNRKKEQNLFYDHKCHFLNIIDFSKIFIKIFKKKLIGTFNIPSKIYLSRFEFISYFFKINNIDNKFLKKKSINDFNMFNIPKKIKIKTKLSTFKYLTKKQNFEIKQ